MIKKQKPWHVCRTLTLSHAPPDLREVLPGVLAWHHQSPQRWVLLYDVREVQFASIAHALAMARPRGLLWRWRVKWYQFQDVNNRDNLQAKDGPCCNRPPRA